MMQLIKELINAHLCPHLLFISEKHVKVFVGHGAPSKVCEQRKLLNLATHGKQLPMRSVEDLTHHREAVGTERSISEGCLPTSHEFCSSDKDSLMCPWRCSYFTTQLYAVSLCLERVSEPVKQTSQTSF
jgi:hypothetical protein